MTANFPYSEASNFRTMFDITDLRGPLPYKATCPSSITGILQSHPYLSKAQHVLKQSGLESLYDDPQANFTLFVPSDHAYSRLEPGVFENIDLSIARHLIQGNTLKRKITKDLLQNTPVAQYETKSPPNRLFVSNLSGKTFINNCVPVLQFNIEATNGIIHVLDGVVWPIIV